MENKLKLEHIAAYLPYGLKCHNMGTSLNYEFVNGNPRANLTFQFLGMHNERS